MSQIAAHLQFERFLLELISDAVVIGGATLSRISDHTEVTVEHIETSFVQTCTNAVPLNIVI
ncbi:hypothetical protein D3C75_1201300 [compost metagenome]